MEWVGADSQSSSALVARPQHAPHIYLFDMAGLPPAVDVQIASRTFLVSAGAGVVLAIGLLLMYVPWLRSAGVLFVLAVALLAAGIRFPEPALLIAQIATLGIILTVLALFLKRLFDARGSRRIVTRGGAGSSIQYRSTEIFEAPAAVGSSMTSTIARPSVVEGGVVES